MSDKVIHLGDSASFNELKSSGVVLVDFYADRCGPCKMLGPIMDELATDYDGRATIIKIDVDSHSDIAGTYSVRSIPTVIVFKDGELQGEPMVWAFPKEQYSDVLDSLL